MIDVSNPMKGDIDYVNDGVPPATLYEAQNAWYSLIDSAGSSAVRKKWYCMLAYLLTPRNTWRKGLNLKHRARPSAKILSEMHSARRETDGDTLASLTKFETFSVRLGEVGEVMGGTSQRFMWTTFLIVSRPSTNEK